MSFVIPNSTEHFDKEFARNGAWEANNGRDQTRRFAECFVKHIQVPLENFSLLDIGCALGDSLPVIKKTYPNTNLFGCDVSSTAVERCNEEYGDIASFFHAGFDDITDCVDVILCSNVLEHFAAYKEITSMLLLKCKILYILTPYCEFKKGKPLSQSTNSVMAGHISTFYKDSFDDLYLNNEISEPVQSKIVRCPKAWSPSMPREIWNELRRPFKMLYRRSYVPPKNRQIIYTLVTLNDLSLTGS